jgi:hypothetical protein
MLPITLALLCQTAHSEIDLKTRGILEQLIDNSNLALKARTVTAGKERPSAIDTQNACDIQ